MTNCKTRIEWAGKSYALLTWTTDMQAWSFSLPAGREGSCPYATTDKEGSVCNRCYAMQSRYCMPSVLHSQFARLFWLKHHLRQSSATRKTKRYWDAVDFMAAAVTRNYSDGWFRIHDSGDFFSVPYIHFWRDVAEQTPDVWYFVPTRAWLVTKWIPELVKLNALENVAVLPSAVDFGEPPPTIEGLDAGTMVIHSADDPVPNHVTICPKSLNHPSSCEAEGCRSCWYGDTPKAFIDHARAPATSFVPYRLTVKGEFINS